MTEMKVEGEKNSKWLHKHGLFLNNVYSPLVNVQCSDLSVSCVCVCVFKKEQRKYIR